MDKTLKIVIVSIALAALAVFGYWTISPLFITVKVNEEPPTQVVPVVQVAPSTPEGAVEPGKPDQSPSPVISLSPARAGTFTGLQGHKASGTATLLTVDGRQYVRFAEDFTVTNGPDLYVYLGRDGRYDPAAILGRLKGNVGAQNYEIPIDLDVSTYDSVWVWCKAFSVAFGSAPLQ